jgi:hypothetical protein
MSKWWKGVANKTSNTATKRPRPEDKPRAEKSGRPPAKSKPPAGHGRVSRTKLFGFHELAKTAPFTQMEEAFVMDYHHYSNRKQMIHDYYKVGKEKKFMAVRDVYTQSTTCPSRARSMNTWTTRRTNSRANSGTLAAYPHQKPRHSRGPPPRRGDVATGADQPHHVRATTRAPTTVPHRTTMPDAGAAASAGATAKTNSAAAGTEAVAEAAHVSAGATKAVTASSAGAARAASARATVPAKCANETITRMVAQRRKTIERDATITTARTVTDTPPTTAITATGTPVAGAGAGADADVDVGEELTHQCTTAMRRHYRKHPRAHRNPHPHLQAHLQAQKDHRVTGNRT